MLDEPFARAADFEGEHLDDVFAVKNEQDLSEEASMSIFPVRQFSFL